MNNQELAKWYAVGVGVVLVLVGLLGFVDNPIVGDPQNDPIFHTGLVHNLVHIVTGALALFIGLGLRGEQRANGLIGFGVLYAAVMLLTLVDPRMFGLLEHPVNAADHVLHLGLAAASIGIGWLARTEGPRVARSR